MKLSAKAQAFLISLSVFSFSALFYFQLPVRAKQNQVRVEACQARQNGILQRIRNLNRLTNTMFDNFNEKADKVEEYYTSVVLPEAKTVSNYSSLAADIAAKKANAQTALTKAQNDSAFSCDSDNPKAKLMQYKADMQAVKKALKEYRTSIKNLIVAVRTVNKPTGGATD